jgi:UDP-N-acetyl-D-galactosamine dehydrogenase
MKENKIAVIGLGYVGLPLANEFGKYFQTIGYDINEKRIADLKFSIDITNELTAEDFENSKFLSFTSEINEISKCNIYIITVPTPTKDDNSPDLSYIESATELVSKVMSKGDIVIYESTVYPGCTEDFCVPILEKRTKFTFNVDFFVGYSPERINPADKNNKLSNIVKITSGSTHDISVIIADLYSVIIKAGIYKAPSIKVAEAAKAIENAQRDLNISFMNEIALIFDRLGINTRDVIEAASTKWNFLKFEPGLVGGHCIGVDPYYLTYISEKNNYYPEVILSGRRVNERIGEFVAQKVVKILSKKKIQIHTYSVLILGFSFKENCPDYRNTGVYKLFKAFLDFGINPDIFDPIVDREEVYHEYGLKLLEGKDLKKYDAIIIAVSHEYFKNIDFNNLKKNDNSIIFDIKGFINKNKLNYFVDSEL